MDRKRFYASLRARGSGVFGTSLSQKQVDGMELILTEAQMRGVGLRHLAYILATVYHETARTMQPIAEFGKGKGRKYGVPAGPHGHVYYGRGYVQLTWLENYQKASGAVGVDLVKNPDRAMEPRIAFVIMFKGMEEGWFTGKKLTDYILGTKTDYKNARRIINGTDKAALIAGYAVAFEKALQAGAYIGQAPKTLPIPDPKPVEPPKAAPAPVPEPKPASKAPGIIGLLLMLGAALAAILAELLSKG